jgi:hypothetical protein
MKHDERRGLTMYFHLIPLEELKRHSVTYWRPGRDHSPSAESWVVLAELESGYITTVLDLPADATATVRDLRAEDVLALFLRGDGAQAAR